MFFRKGINSKTLTGVIIYMWRHSSIEYQTTVVKNISIYLLQRKRNCLISVPVMLYYKHNITLLESTRSRGKEWEIKKEHLWALLFEFSFVNSRVLERLYEVEETKVQVFTPPGNLQEKWTNARKPSFPVQLSLVEKTHTYEDANQTGRYRLG